MKRLIWAVPIALLFVASAISPAQAVGGWKVVRTESIAVLGGGLLAVTTIPGTSSSLAVGGYASQPLIEEHAGSGSTPWHIVLSSVPGLQGGLLSDVVAFSSHDAWSVGQYGDGTQGLPLLLHWDGASWTQVAAPADSGSTNGLAILSASGGSANDVWVAGYRFTTKFEPLVLHWDGTTWSVVPTPDLGNRVFGFAVASIPGTQDVWLSGQIQTDAGDTTFFLRGNASRWDSPILIPSAPKTSDRVNALVARSPVSAYAVGSTVGFGRERAAIFRWNGTDWRRQKVPATREDFERLNDVAATTSGGVWAVGFTSPFGPRTLTLRLNKGAWEIVPSPTPGTGAALNGISRNGTPNGLWAVGFMGQPGGPTVPLALRR